MTGSRTAGVSHEASRWRSTTVDPSAIFSVVDAATLDPLAALRES
jgi:hypothetical protein